MSWEIGTSLVRRNLQSVNKERMPVLQHNVNDLIDAREVYFNFGAFHRKAFIVINFSPIATKLIRFQLKYQESPSISNLNFDVDIKQDAMRKPFLNNQGTRQIE